MSSEFNRGGRQPCFTRKLGMQSAITALAVGASALCGCNRDEVVRAFRAGASDQLQSGVESIALGVINGAFSAFDLGSADSGAGSTDTGGAATP